MIQTKCNLWDFSLYRASYGDLKEDTQSQSTDRQNAQFGFRVTMVCIDPSFLFNCSRLFRFCFEYVQLCEWYAEIWGSQDMCGRLSFWELNEFVIYYPTHDIRHPRASLCARNFGKEFPHKSVLWWISPNFRERAGIVALSLCRSSRSFSQANIFRIGLGSHCGKWKFIDLYYRPPSGELLHEQQPCGYRRSEEFCRN